jgi:hypothetical protein
MPSRIFFPNKDVIDDAIVTIDTTHHEIHEGHGYAFHVENLTPTSGVTQYIEIASGAKQPHIFLDFEAIGGLCKIQMFEGGTVLTAGTVITSYNRNRPLASVHSALLTIRQGSTVTTVGSVFATRTILASATAQGKVTSAVREGAERVWNANTTYLIGITPLAASMIWTADGLFEEAAI